MEAIILASGVFVWLVVCAGFDLRLRQVPNWLTLIPLAGGMLLASLRGNWPAAVLVVLMIFLSDLPKRVGAGIATAALIAVGLVSYKLLGLPLDAVLTQIILFVAWQLWLNHLTGGADAKILMTLTLLYGSGVFLAATLAGGVFGLGALLLKKKMLPYVLPIAAGTTVFLIFSLAKLI